MSMVVGEAPARDPKPVPNTPENVLQQFSMKGKVVAVNGASDGIGLAVVEAMAEAGKVDDGREVSEVGNEAQSGHRRGR